MKIETSKAVVVIAIICMTFSQMLPAGLASSPINVAEVVAPPAQNAVPVPGPTKPVNPATPPVVPPVAIPTPSTSISFLTGVPGIGSVVSSIFGTNDAKKWTPLERDLIKVHLAARKDLTATQTADMKALLATAGVKKADITALQVEQKAARHQLVVDRTAEMRALMVQEKEERDALNQEWKDLLALQKTARKTLETAYHEERKQLVAANAAEIEALGKINGKTRGQINTLRTQLVINIQKLMTDHAAKLKALMTSQKTERSQLRAELKPALIKLTPR